LASRTPHNFTLRNESNVHGNAFPFETGSNATTNFFGGVEASDHSIVPSSPFTFGSNGNGGSSVGQSPRTPANGSSFARASGSGPNLTNFSSIERNSTNASVVGQYITTSNQSTEMSEETMARVRDLQKEFDQWNSKYTMAQGEVDFIRGKATKCGEELDALKADIRVKKTELNKVTSAKCSKESELAMYEEAYHNRKLPLQHARRELERIDSEIRELQPVQAQCNPLPMDADSQYVLLHTISRSRKRDVCSRL